MENQAQGLISLFRTTVLLGVIALLIMSVALPMAGQSSVPPTAVQAARMPQFAAKLAHPGSRSMPRTNPGFARQDPHDGPPQGNVAYDNGPINGMTYAWAINFGFVVSDTMTVSAGTTLTGMAFGAWLNPGDTLVSAEVSITSEPNGGTVYFDRFINFIQSGCVLNQYGFNVCTESSEQGFGPTLDYGPFWVNLKNAVVTGGNPVYWDENSGVGCQSSGCPSQASQNEIGTIPSEAFTIFGTLCVDPSEKQPAATAKAVTVPPSPTQTYRVIYNFTGAGDGGSPTTGLAIDTVGNLYGTTSIGGPSGGGTVFKLIHGTSGWRFNRLYSFFGANGSGPDSTLVIDPEGRLYGTAGGGSQGDGVLFGLSPAGNILPSVFSNWMETLLYSFTDGSDGASPEGSLVLDSSGNIYGTATTGGANGSGTLYEFINAGIQNVHAFPAFNGDGAIPIGVVNGSDGLYGITSYGGDFSTGTLYTTAGGYQVLYSFGPYELSGGPTSLAADHAGNLYGADASRGCYEDNSRVYEFSPPHWDASTLVDFGGGVSPKVSTDALGNVYGTTDYGGQNNQGNVFELTCCWSYTDLYDFTGGNDGALPMAVVVDAQGNIYGTTTYGGTHGLGVVWEISP